MDLTLLICNYNTPTLVVNLLKSVNKVCIDTPDVIVINTSDNESANPLDEHKIPYYNFRGGTHGEAVNLGLQKVKTRYVLLLDSDVIILKDFSQPFEKFKRHNFALMGKVVGDCAGKKLYERVEPWFCFMDLDKIKYHKIKFFDRERHMKRHTEKVDKLYDIGSTMFEDLTSYGYVIGNVDMENKYFRHYGGMSWHCNNYDSTKPDTDVDFGGTHPNKSLYNHGLMVKQQYEKDIGEMFNEK
jgi:glycosyltransferase involved in cell wall biosynthesis